MKQTLFLSLLSLLFFCSCSNDFELIEEKKEIPVVYGLLDASQNNQFIRLERAFADENISGLEIAQNPDSLYYKDAIVKVTNVRTGVEYVFTEIDGNDIGLVRDPDGVFATDPNTLYTFPTGSMDLNYTDDYKLTVLLKEEEFLTAETKVVNQPRFQSPSSSQPNINFKYGTDFRIDFEHRDNGVLGDVRFVVRLIEFDVEGNTEEISIVWDVERAIDNGRTEVNGEDFYTLIASALEEKAGIRRSLVSVDLEIVSGGESISNFVNVGLANAGITSSGETPVFTNLSRGVGIFSSKNRTIGVYGLTQQSQDSLRNGIYTKHLNFE